MFIRLALVFVIVGVVTNAVSDEDVIAEEWNLFKVQYEKGYETLLEEEFRFNIFKANKIRIAEHNQLFVEGKVSYDAEVNEFSDKLPHEIFKTMPELAIDDDLEEAMDEADIYDTTENWFESVPPYFDWRSKGAVTNVKHQGNCSASWAFAAVGALESQYIIRKRQHVALSVQNLIDCSKRNDNCHGGWPVTALYYIKSNKGIDTERSYNYTGKYNKTCNFRKNNVGATVHSVHRIPKNERILKSFVYEHGPVAVSINANDHGFHTYKSGVYENAHCSKKPNHSVLIVGFGTERGHDYWLIKNSWGTQWGMGGYMKIARNKNMCGIAGNAVFPFV